MTDAARLEAWRERLDADAHRREAQADRLLALWAGAVLVLMLLYVCIGPNPYPVSYTHLTLPTKA